MMILLVLRITHKRTQTNTCKNKPKTVGQGAVSLAVFSLNQRHEVSNGTLVDSLVRAGQGKGEQALINSLEVLPPIK